MARIFHHGLPDFWRKGSTTFLALSFLLGLVFGVAVFSAAGDSFLSLMRGILSGSVSIVGLLCVTFLPFLFSAFAVSISEPWLLLPVSFGKAFLFSLVSLGLLQGFGSAGWLVRWLLMFSDLVSLPLLYGFWQRHISGERRYCFAECFALLSFFFLIGSVDYCCISPFLADLIHF